MESFEFTCSRSMSLAGLAKCGRSKDMGGEGFAPTKVFDPTNKLESVGAAPPPTT